MAEKDPSTETTEQAPAEAPEMEQAEKDRTTADPAPDANADQVPGVTDAAPENLDTDPASSVVVPSDSEYSLDLPATMADQKAPKLVGEAEKRGYYGETAADRAKAEKAELDSALTVQDNAEAVANVSTENQE